MVNETRRRVLSWVSGSVFLPLSNCSNAPSRWSAPAPSATKQRPNIVFILADDLGFADLSCFGRRDYQTPELDRLASQGMKLTRSYASSPVCSPTRLALLTGQYQYRFEAGLEEPLIPRVDLGAPRDVKTLPGELKALGYQTALIGKWHLGAQPEHNPIFYGYDSFFGFNHGWLSYHGHKYYSGRTMTALDEGLLRDQTSVEETGYLTDLFTEEAVQFVEGQASTNEPFFLSLHYSAPHWPWEGPDDAAKPFSAPRDTDSGNIETYAKMVQNMDANIGRLLRVLAATGQAENTIIVFTSDNGGERFSDHWPFVGAKGELLEGGIRVPTLVRWPGHIEAGSVSDNPVMTMDWMPTLLSAAAGGHVAGKSDGLNILPMLFGGGEWGERGLYWRYKAHGQAVMMRGDWKYLKLGQKEFLFNLAQDQRERANLAQREPERFAEMKSAFATWNAEMLPYSESTYSHDTSAIYSDRF